MDRDFNRRSTSSGLRRDSRWSRARWATRPRAPCRRCWWQARVSASRSYSRMRVPGPVMASCRPAGRSKDDEPRAVVLDHTTTQILDRIGGSVDLCR